MATAGELFPDRGMMLGVLNALIGTGSLDEDEISSLLTDIAEKHYGLDPDEESLEIESKRAEEALGRLSSLTVEGDALAGIAALDFDGGNDIYMTLEGALDIDTGGEEDWYQLNSLDGIEQLPDLTDLNLDAYGYRDAALDLSPLAEHPGLATVLLTGRCTNVAALTTLPALERVDVRMATLDAAKVVEDLASRGINVRR